VASAPSKTTTQRGYGYKWQKLRQRIIRRDKGLCQICLKQGRISPGNEVDHVLRKADGGGDVAENLQVLCQRCHSEKTAQENGAKLVGCDVNGYPLNTVK